MATPSLSNGQDVTRGILFMVATMGVFAAQDGISRHLAELHHPIFIVMIRYWAFAAFVIVLSANRPGGLRGATRTAHPAIQMLRGLMLAGQICIVTYCFTQLGLAATHSVLSSYPLLVAAAGALFLGERVTLAQWFAILIGFIGILVLVQPGAGVFEPLAVVPLFCAGIFASYIILTRWVGRRDTSATSFFFTGIGGAVGITLIGPFFWSTLSGTDWLFMAALCVTGALGHFLMIKAYEHAEAASLQPFAYLQLVLTTIIGITVFDETIDASFLIGATLVVAGGLMALFLARRKA